MGPLLSNVSPQIRAILQDQQAQSLTLRQGQVMLGKIKELLPNNVAVVQFGHHQITAKLEVPISVDQAYLFEVISTGELPQLSVVSQSMSNVSIAEQIQLILAKLNLSPTLENRQFVQELLTNEIPVRQTDLKQALEIFKNNQTQETVVMGPLFSNVSPQIRAILQDQQAQSLTLRQGQVMLGKIKELLPNNVAVVQFGHHQITAKLEVPISVDQAYLFEVISTGELPQLSVVSQSMSNVSIAEQIQLILAKLNLSPTLENRQFVQELLTNEIPVRQTDLKQALEIFKNNQTQETKELLLHLLKRQFPVSELTLNAVKAVRSNQPLNNQMIELYQAIEQQPSSTVTSNQLLDQLAQLINNDSITGQPIPLTDQEMQSLSSMLQQSNITGTDGSGALQANELIESATIGNQPTELNLTTDSIVNRMEAQLALTDKQLFQFKKVLTQIQHQAQFPSPRSIEQLEMLLKNTTVTHKLIQHLPSQAVESLENFISQPNQANLTEWIEPLTNLINLQLPSENKDQIYNLLTRLDRANPDMFPIKDQFIIHLKNYLLNTGLDYEYQIANEDQQGTNQTGSLKQLILQSFTDQSVGGREAEQLLNHLTGQQLTMINETANFLHLSTSIPGLFGQEDIEIEFYSRKDESERIDSDYCRIAFYLELDQLKTTMIDMNVQNRVVHLTVYNDQDLSDLLNQFKPLLKQGLARFNYHLSTTSYKPFPDKRTDFAVKPESQATSIQSSRWDVRI